MTKTNKTSIAYAAVALTLALSALLAWASFRPRALETVKELTVNIHHADGRLAVFPVETNARTLLEALEDQAFAELGPTEFGDRMLTADGEYADPGESVFWVFTVNGELPEDRADTQAVADGDVFDYYILTY